MCAKRWTLPAAGVLVAAVLLTACGDVAPTATPVLPPFQSGGIGLTRAAWEQQHPPLATPTVGLAFIWYPESQYQIYFWPDSPSYIPTSDSVIAAIILDTQTDEQELRIASVRSLLPADAQLEAKSLTHYDQMWYSLSLVSRYPALASVPQPWNKAGPGWIKVAFIHNGCCSSKATISASLNYPAVPTEAMPTLTPCGDHPCPTPTYFLPSAERTTVGSPLPRGLGTKLPVQILTGVPLVPIPTATVLPTP